MPLSRTIPLDLPCASCGYNLRGLELSQKCPECGTAVNETIEIVRAGVRPDLTGAALRLQRHWIDEVARHAAVTRDAVLFINDAFTASARVVTSESEGYVEGNYRHVTARDLCARVHEYAQFYFNDADEARELLAHWGIRSGEDVGRVIFAFVELGVLQASPTDTIRDFDNLFTLELLFGPEDEFSRRALIQRAEEAPPRMLLSRRPIFSFFCVASLACAGIVAILWVRSHSGEYWLRMDGGQTVLVHSSAGMLGYERLGDPIPDAHELDTPWLHMPGAGAQLKARLARIRTHWWNYLGFNRLSSPDHAVPLTTIPHALPCVLFATPVVLWLRLHLRLKGRLRLGQCLNCGYDLRGSKERCPECNEEIRPAQLRAAQRAASALAK